MARPRANRRSSDPKAARRDSLDFRDWIYEPALVPLAESKKPKKRWIEVLNQGEEGACTGFGLAAVINYLLRERDGDDAEKVSPRMLYEMAKHHDRWPGESYDGSSARGAMKGWYKNGVCPAEAWPYEIDDPGELTPEAREKALRYPLGAFYRVLPRRADLHAALNEVQVVFATAATHKGWDEPKDGVIEFKSTWVEQGGHAFAILGYTEDGYLIQNSWDDNWGGVKIGRTFYPGCAIWLYEDFDRNLWDAWVARVGRPYESLDALSFSTGRREEYTRGTAPAQKSPPRAVIRDHFFHIDDGGFDPKGDYYSSAAEARDILKRALQSDAKHLVFYAHGGLNSVKGAVRRVHKWMPAFERNRIHEIHLVWETGLWAEIRDILLGKQDFVEDRAGGIGNWWDRWIERITGPAGRGIWSEMRSDAEIAFGQTGTAGRIVLETLLAELSALPESKRPKLHLAGHSAGSILLGRLLADWDQLQVGAAERFKFDNLVLFAPACTHDFFSATLKPALASHSVRDLYHFYLDDDTERDDTVAKIYRKSLLYLVSRAYQKKGQVVPLLGMAKHLGNLDTEGVKSRVHHYNNGENPGKTSSRSHGGFDNDLTTMNNMLEIVLGATSNKGFERTELEGY